MALQSEVSPPMVGDPNKDTKNDGDTKSDENDSTSTDEDIDLEEGEILDSGGEAEEEEKKDLTNSSLKEALDKNFLKSIEQLASQAKTEVSPPNAIPKKHMSPHNSPVKMRKRSKYLDHDECESNSDQEDGWYSPSRKHKSKVDSKPLDYRMELEAYIGTPPSSPPERKHRDKEKKKKSRSKSKKSGKKIKRRDIKGEKVKRYIKEAMKRKMCKFFKEGKCAKGADCGFSHSTPHSYKKKELCKFYLSGHCNKGKECTFMHGEFPCKFYHTGSECYAKDACRFSHEPLTDEMKRVLGDYLRMHHGDEDYDRERERDRKRRRFSRSPSPEVQKPPPKRTCLLGSPPRHIREAEETKRWQEEMQQQQQNHPGFKIHLGSNKEDGSPPTFQRPIFYQETMPSTPPQKRHMNSDAPVSANFQPLGPGFSLRDTDDRPGFSLQDTDDRPSFKDGRPGFSLRDTDDRPIFSLRDTDDRVRPSPSDIFVYEEDYQDMDDENIKQEPPDFDWKDMHGDEHDLPQQPLVMKTEIEPFVVNPSYDADPAQELDFTSDVKFDETTQFSEMESSTDCIKHSPQNSPSQTSANKESEEEISDQDDVKSDDCITADDLSSAQEPIAAPIIVPAHLPRKTQELFKRIQQKNSVMAGLSDASNSPKAFDTSEMQEKEELEEMQEKPEAEKSESLWYSSEDDDDDDTEPLTNVLKNLQREPPAVNPPAKMEPKPAVSIMAMLNKIQQNTLEKNKVTPESTQGAFFKNLLGTISTPGGNLQLPTPDPQRRTLLPDPPSAPVAKKESVVPPKDPRLKNRDPRLANASNIAPSLPKKNVMEHSISQISSSLPNRELSLTPFPNVNELVKTEMPYKLHGIFTTPPNYASYISASQANPNLLKDPRLRKHMNLAQKKQNGIENTEDIESIITHPVKNAPPIPKLLLKYDKADTLSINIFESSSSKKPEVENMDQSKPQLPKLLDPRMHRRESQNSSGSNTPPHLTIIESATPTINYKTAPTLEREIKPVEEKKEVKPAEEKKWLPPVLEKSWTPPVIPQTWTTPLKQENDSDTDDNPEKLQIDENPESSTDKRDESDSTVASKKAKPNPASHLPRAIADPRMAKLHKPLDSRRSRISTPEPINKNTPELKKVDQNNSSENSQDTFRISSVNSATSEPGSLKIVISVPKKNQEKKKTVHRNRKSSMDYASPLNSCEDSNSNKIPAYNSYNQRPKRTCVTRKLAESSISNTPTNSVVDRDSTATPEFYSDNSSNLECDNSSDVNLKDMFKTIDPTASPFC